jgi:hypothetical protein
MSTLKNQLRRLATPAEARTDRRRWQRRPRFAIALCILIGNAASADVRFNRDVRPILSDKCFACHGPDAAARQADLRLDVREAAESVLAPGRPEESELLARIVSTDPELRMPPESTHKSVSPAEVATLREWIAAGAEYEPHWSFISLREAPVPATGSPWPANAIDQLIFQRLQQSNLAPSPQADRSTLLRRVTLDLTGLPPTPDELRAFLDDPADDDAAFATVVDRLLDSPRFGEHFAWHWLDAARYGDSDGYESDPGRNMWPWRDWVVEAFNLNLPYDQFIIEQLAGDLLPEPTLRQMIASGFNRNHRQNNEGGILPEEWVVEYVCDRAETTATVFMGLTWGCARCHDHKFDPISQRDYYQLFAYFHNVPEVGNGFGESTAVPMLEVSALNRLEEFAAVREELAPLRQRLTEVDQSEAFSARFTEWTAGLTPEGGQQLPKELQEAEPSAWTDAQRSQARAHYLNQVDEEGRAAEAALAPVRSRYDALLKTGAKMMVMGEMETPRATHVLYRGQYDQPRDEVTMSTPAWLPPPPVDAPRNRLGLARWLTSREHPLTSRVAVNRFWQLLFGTGLVKTPEDFGAQGERPSHPELLDWLALDFMDSGWNTKRLVRTIVLSRTYRQSSAVSATLLAIDPDNRLLARGPRNRLPAQVIRDQSLAVSGLLVEFLGGPPVKPYQPDGLWQDIIKGRPVYKRDSGAGLYRRSLYSLWRRAVKPPELVLLDANERDVCTVGQRRTNTPLQALLVLNDVAFVEAARSLAARSLSAHPDDATAMIRDASQRSLGRDLTDAELSVLRTEYARALEEFRAQPERAAALIAIGDSPAPPDAPTDQLAALTIVCRILLNLDETLSRQ